MTAGSAAPCNGTAAAGASTTFGFLGTWNGTNAVPSLIGVSPRRTVAFGDNGRGAKGQKGRGPFHV
jgi:hypothetical protein